jgi:solute carrier family 25 (peroxisomal adenine nucleotide transporter), member 17
MRQVFTLDSFADGVAGAMGGMTAISTFYPLNMIRTKLQTSDPSKKELSIMDTVHLIIKEDGIYGMFKGWWGQIVALGSSNFVYFYTYQMIKVWQQDRTGKKIGPIVNLVVGAIAGIVNVLLTSPLWCVCTRLAVQAKTKKQIKVPPSPSSSLSASPPLPPPSLPEQLEQPEEYYTGMLDGLMKCYKNEGINGLWSGVGTNLILVCNPTLHFFTYERVRQIFERVAVRRGSPITSIEFFCMGAIAKAIATVFTYPVQVAQSQLRNDKKKIYNGTVDCITKIYRIGGITGLFRGINAKLWQTVLTAAFQFMTYEKLRGFIFMVLTGRKKKDV